LPFTSLTSPNAYKEAKMELAVELDAGTNGGEQPWPPATSPRTSTWMESDPSRPRATLAGRRHRLGRPAHADQNSGAASRGKDGGGTALENALRFPLYHSYDGCGRFIQTKHFTC
jgi:hypothetical protein